MLTYDSKASGRVKTYLVHPYRLAYAQGGIYLLAFVPEYDEVRTFAIERVQDVSLLEERFTPDESCLKRHFHTRWASIPAARARRHRVRGRRSPNTSRPASGIHRSNCATRRRSASG